MNPHYKFISDQREQLISPTHYTHQLRSRREKRYGLWVKVIDRLGDVLIGCGSWMKRVSSSPSEDNSVRIYTQN